MCSIFDTKTKVYGVYTVPKGAAGLWIELLFKIANNGCNTSDNQRFCICALGCSGCRVHAV